MRPGVAQLHGRLAESLSVVTVVPLPGAQCFHQANAGYIPDGLERGELAASGVLRQGRQLQWLRRRESQSRRRPAILVLIYSD